MNFDRNECCSWRVRQMLGKVLLLLQYTQSFYRDVRLDVWFDKKMGKLCPYFWKRTLFKSNWVGVPGAKLPLPREFEPTIENTPPFTTVSFPCTVVLTCGIIIERHVLDTKYSEIGSDESYTTIPNHCGTLLYDQVVQFHFDPILCI